MNIKKQYAEIYALLETNKNKKVSTILPQLAELMTTKVNQKTFLKDEGGNVTHVYCYYHKEWEDVTIAEYGTKKGTATGLNTMCKEGVRQWSKQQRDYKKAKEEALTKVMNGELKQEDLEAHMAELLEQSKVIVPREDEHRVDL